MSLAPSLSASYAAPQGATRLRALAIGAATRPPTNVAAAVMVRDKHSYVSLYRRTAVRPALACQTPGVPASAQPVSASAEKRPQTGRPSVILPVTNLNRPTVPAPVRCISIAQYLAKRAHLPITDLLTFDEARRFFRLSLLVFARRLALARLVNAVARAFRAIVKRVAPVVIAGLLVAPAQPLMLAARSVTSIDTTPLVQAAKRKQQEAPMLVHAPRDNAGFAKTHTQLATIKDPQAYAETMKLYNARCDNPHDEAAQRAWEAHSAAAVGGTVLQARVQPQRATV